MFIELIKTIIDSVAITQINATICTAVNTTSNTITKAVLIAIVDTMVDPIVAALPCGRRCTAANRTWEGARTSALCARAPPVRRERVQELRRSLSPARVGLLGPGGR